MAAGGRNAYVLAMNSVRQDERKRKQDQEELIREKVQKAKDKKLTEEKNNND
jgi:ATP synthase protein I